MSNNIVRCFIAIRLSPTIILQISSYIEALQKISQDIRWTKAENIHLTLKFLGEIEDSRADMVKEKLYSVSKVFSQFSLKISGSGSFPGRKRPRVFWLGMEQSHENPLFTVHKWIEDNLHTLGFEKEKRRFSPHLTIGRVRSKYPADFTDLFSFMDKNPFPPIDLKVENLFFIQSFLKPTGAEYNIIESYPLR